MTLIALSACASSVKTIPLTLDPLSPPEVSEPNLERNRDGLALFIQKNPSEKERFQDALLILEAMLADRQGDVDRSLQHWRDALHLAKGAFGEKSFIGWLKAYTKKLGQRFEKADLAARILSELNRGQSIPWMIESGFSGEQKLIPYLQKTVPESLKSDSTLTNENLNAPQVKGIPQSDPLLTKLSSEVCKYKSSFGDGWEKWRSSLTNDVLKYFDALIAQCSGQTTTALSLFNDVTPMLASNASTAPLALEGFSRMIKMRRDQGERESVAPLYMPFMKIWKDPAITETSLGLTRSEFEQRRIEDAFWAARARASIGDSASAKSFIYDVLDYVESALSQTYGLSIEQKNTLLATAGEAYHFLAFRLAVEAKDWSRASEVAQMALERHNLPNDWRDRIRFSLGVYRYLAGEFDLARKSWEELLTDIADEKLRPAVLFWISQSHQKLGNNSEAAFYRKSLSQDYPLSFYSVVALGAAKTEDDGSWKDLFNSFSELRQSALNWQEVDIDDLRLDNRRGPLVRRAEVFASLGMSQFANTSLDELQKSIDWQQTQNERQVAWGLYISRLYGFTGNWFGTISLTTKLSKDPEFWQNHPEQMLFYFPMPFASIFKTVAKEKNLKPEMLMAIARQESSFRVDVKSPANAWGLMQLTPPTAKRLLPMAGLGNGASVKVPDSLVSADLNIRLGATFVQELDKRFSGARPQIFASYNAGIQTIENWVERRLFEDPFLFIEMIPYQETRDYVKGVWRNEVIYGFLSEAVR